MALTLPTYTVDAKNYIQGPGKAYIAPYVAAGGDAQTADIVPIGLFDKNGIEWDHKLTFADVESDQFTYAIETFLTKQEVDVKITMQEMSPHNFNVALGQVPQTLNGVQQNIGEFFDIYSGVPSTRPPMRQWIFQFPSPGHDNNTNPIAEYAYLQLFKAAIVAHGPFKIGKDHLGTMQITVRAYVDTSIQDSTLNVGKLFLTNANA